MNRSLHDHVIDLEHSVQALRDRLTDLALTDPERKQLHAAMARAELALAYYRKAHDLEQSVAGTTPTPSAGSENLTRSEQGRPNAPQDRHRSRSKTRKRHHVRSKADLRVPQSWFEGDRRLKASPDKGWFAKSLPPAMRKLVPVYLESGRRFTDRLHISSIHGGLRFFVRS
jgi:hypothetical protein